MDSETKHGKDSIRAARSGSVYMVIVQGSRSMMTPVKRKANKRRYQLSALVRGIKSKNRPKSIETGKRYGRETW